MTESTKQVKLVLPEHLWLALSNLAKKQKTSLQTVIVEGLLTYYGIQHWRKKSKEVEAKEVEEILVTYSDIPEDLQSLIDKSIKEMDRRESEWQNSQK